MLKKTIYYTYFTVGRYIYLIPFEYGVNLYSSRLIRITCGDKSIIDEIDSTLASGRTLRDLIVSLDLTQKDTKLVGFSGAYHGNVTQLQVEEKICIAQTSKYM
jgi:hypothetical protein